MKPSILSFSLLLWSIAGGSEAGLAQSDTASLPEECSLLLFDGKEIAVTRFWRISNDRVEYEHDGSLHDLLLSDIWSVQCGNLDYAFVDGFLRPVPSAPVSLLNDTAGLGVEIDYFKLGKEDGAKYYRGGGAFAGGFLTSPTLIIPWIIAAVPPPLDTQRNPNAHLYRTNPEYLKGYRRKAHGKKAAHALLGGTIGLMTLLVMATR